MIITSSNVDMYSKRQYSQTLNTSGTILMAQLDGDSKLAASDNFTRSYTESSENATYNQAASFSSAESNAIGTGFEDYLSNSFIYNRVGFLSSQTIDTESENAMNALTTSASETPFTEDICKDSQTFFRHNTKQVLSKMMNLLRFLAKHNGKTFHNDLKSYYALSDQENSYTVNASYSTISESSISATHWTVSADYTSIYEEAEQTQFSASGTAVTADGRELPINITMNMSRDFMEKTDLTYLTSYTSIFTDPLVINLGNNPVSMSDRTFSFDIDSDGNTEELSQLGTGSGFLTLDKNNDGIINNGSELFGTKSGDGFADLSQYDSDHNGWIDEADDIYDQLKVWTKDEAGKDVYLTLKQADVGAIYLGRANTEFTLADDNNKAQGIVRSTGIYLHENGQTGSVQQIDVAVS